MSHSTVLVIGDDPEKMWYLTARGIIDAAPDDAQFSVYDVHI